MDKFYSLGEFFHYYNKNQNLPRIINLEDIDELEERLRSTGHYCCVP